MKNCELLYSGRYLGERLISNNLEMTKYNKLSK